MDAAVQQAPPRERREVIIPNAVRVTAADFNGSSFDGSPFNHVPPWLKEAEDAGLLSLYASTTDYAMWLVGEDKRKTGPGDWIVRSPKGEVFSFGETDWSSY